MEKTLKTLIYRRGGEHFTNENETKNLNKHLFMESPKVRCITSILNTKHDTISTENTAIQWKVNENFQSIPFAATNIVF